YEAQPNDDDPTSPKPPHHPRGGTTTAKEFIQAVNKSLKENSPFRGGRVLNVFATNFGDFSIAFETAVVVSPGFPVVPFTITIFHFALLLWFSHFSSLRRWRETEEIGALGLSTNDHARSVHEHRDALLAQLKTASEALERLAEELAAINAKAKSAL